MFLIFPGRLDFVRRPGPTHFKQKLKPTMISNLSAGWLAGLAGLAGSLGHIGSNVRSPAVPSQTFKHLAPVTMEKPTVVRKEHDGDIRPYCVAFQPFQSLKEKRAAKHILALQ